jgi:hypothetical protein
MRRKSKLMVTTAGMAILAFTVGIKAQAATMSITYNNAGDLDADPIQNGNILTLDALATGSVVSGISSLHAVWNPATFHTHDDLD